MRKLTLLLLLSTPAPIWAQTTDAGVTAQSPAGQEGAAAQGDGVGASSQEAAAGGDIIVTAQRRSERLQDVPVSITAVGEETLRSRVINNVLQLTQVAPSLQVGNNDNLFIRGIGSLAFAQSLETSVAIAQDEVNLAGTILGGAQGTFYDIARVEVLNGPQGLLFGRNASAGLVNIISRQPEIGQWSGQAELEGQYRPTTATNGGGLIARATVNVPVTGNSALRVNAMYTTQAPLLRFVGSADNDLAVEQFGFRAKYLVNFTDALSLYVIGDYNEDHGLTGFFDQTYRSLAAASPLNALNTGLGIVPGPNNLSFGGEVGSYRDLTRGGLQATLAYQLPSGIEISNITAWKAAKRRQNYDTDLTNANGASINRNRTTYSQVTNELRLALPAQDRLTGQVGAYFFRAKSDFFTELYGNNLLPAAAARNFPFCVGATVGVGPCTVSNIGFLGQDREYDLTTTSYAGFGQLTYELVPGLKVIAGARVTHDVGEIDLRQGQQRYFVRLNQSLRTQDEFSNTDFSYRLGAQYNFTPDLMVYGTLARGYKGPGFSENVVLIPGTTTPASAAIAPEINNNIELGLKSAWLNRNLIFNLALFRSKFKNLQVQAFDAVLGSTITQNAARATSQGIEGTLNLRPARGFSINASATLLDAKFDDFPGVQCYTGQTGCVGGNFNAGGLATPQAPKFSATVQAQYEWALESGADAFVEGNLAHKSSQWTTINQTPGTRIEANQLLGASIGLRSSDGWRMSLFCRNCTDERVPIFLGTVASEAVAGRIGILQSFGFNSFRTIGINFSGDF